MHVFELADRIRQGEYSHSLSGKTVVLFFPSSSIRTRITYEKGIKLLGGHTILFDSDVLEKKEMIEDSTAGNHSLYDDELRRLIYGNS